ncbi:aldo/keto reductase [Nakamurella leprariae]|nr:aldo/keto reductase [Nakamurella leprariae]
MSTAGPSPTLTLNNGVPMPALGLGVFQSTAEQTADVVTTAIAAGYRLIDTAAAYFNEEQVGEGIRRSGIDREDVFVTTKLWMTDHGRDRTRKAFDASLRRLGLDRLDLYLIHWPEPASWSQTVESWLVLEELLAEGRVRAIGVCNHHPHHLRDLIDAGSVVPAVNQVELHPFFNQPRVRPFNAAHGVITQSWAPIGGGRVYNAGRPDAPHSPLEHPTITGVAERFGKSSAQVVIRWHLQHGLSVIPKSADPQRIAENIDVFDFELSADDVAAIDALGTANRAGGDPEVVDRRLHSVTIDND